MPPGYITPPVLCSNSFETVTNGIYTNGAVLEGWQVTNNRCQYYGHKFAGLLDQ